MNSIVKSLKSKSKEVLKSRKTKEALKVIVMCGIIWGVGTHASAAEGTEAIDKIITWIASWTLKIGLIVAFIGGIQTALGFKNENADEKVRGLKTLAAGFMVAGVSKSLDLFGLA